MINYCGDYQNTYQYYRETFLNWCIQEIFLLNMTVVHIRDGKYAVKWIIIIMYIMCVFYSKTSVMKLT